MSPSSSSSINFSYPHFDERTLPSIVSAPYLSIPEERTKRRRTCRFIEQAGRNLRLPRIPVATAMVFFHRFYAKHSFGDHDRFEVAMACVLLAAKTEESPRKLTVVIQKCYQLKERHGNNQGSVVPSTTSSSSTNRGGGRKSNIETMDTKGTEFLMLKERILLLERIVLHTIAFELSIDHPFKPIVDQVKKMNQPQNQKVEYVDDHRNKNGEGSTTKSSLATSSSTNTTLSKDLVNRWIQTAMNFANDAGYTCLCLQHSATALAGTCIYMSAQFCGIRPVDGRSWLDLLGLEVEVLASISEQILELIAAKKGCEVDFDGVKKRLNELKEIRLLKKQRIM